MIAGPLIDHVHRLAVVEVTVLRLGIVEFIGLLYEAVLQLIALTFVNEDGIGNKRLGLLIECIGICKHLLTEGVDSISASLAEAESAIDFLQRLSCGPVVHQAKGESDTERRHNAARLATSLTEEVESEIVVARDQLPFIVCQLDFLRSLEAPSGEIEVFSLNKCQVLIIIGTVATFV